MTKSYKVSEIEDLNFFNSIFYRGQTHKAKKKEQEKRKPLKHDKSNISDTIQR